MEPTVLQHRPYHVFLSHEIAQQDTEGCC